MFRQAPELSAGRAATGARSGSLAARHARAATWPTSRQRNVSAVETQPPLESSLPLDGSGTETAPDGAKTRLAAVVVRSKTATSDATRATYGWPFCLSLVLFQKIPPGFGLNLRRKT